MHTGILQSNLQALSGYLKKAPKPLLHHLLLKAISPLSQITLALVTQIILLTSIELFLQSRQDLTSANNFECHVRAGYS